MKKDNFLIKTLLIYSTMVCLTIACKPDAPISSGGSAGATINGKPWIADEVRCQTNVPCYGDRLGLGLWRQLPSTNVESFYFHNVPARVGTYAIYASGNQSPCEKDTVASSFDMSIGGDVSGERFLPIGGASNQLRITQYNEKTGEIRGSFAGTYVISNRRYQSYPDTLHVTDSQFRTIVIK